MQTDLLFAFMAYALVTSITPGPNNSMLLASGLNYGFLRSLPHALGVTCGFAVMVLAVGAGLGGLFTAYPPAYRALRITSALYLLWLAWKIARAQPIEDGETAGRPFSLWQAAAFQWVNPKAWIMAIGAIAAYAPAQGGLPSVLLIALLFALVNLPSVALWAAFGSSLRRWLTDPRHLRVFNVAMALLLVLSLYPLLLGHGAK